jgi:GGDEF domain-containing protein
VDVALAAADDFDLIETGALPALSLWSLNCHRHPGGGIGPPVRKAHAERTGSRADALTGLHNRRAFVEAVGRFARSRRTRQP